MKKVRTILSVLMSLCLVVGTFGVSAFAGIDDPTVIFVGMIYDQTTGELVSSSAYVTIKDGDGRDITVTEAGKEPMLLRVYAQGGVWEYVLDKGVNYTFTVHAKGYQNSNPFSGLAPWDHEDEYFVVSEVYLRPDAPAPEPEPEPEAQQPEPELEPGAEIEINELDGTEAGQTEGSGPVIVPVITEETEPEGLTEETLPTGGEPESSENTEGVTETEGEGTEPTEGDTTDTTQDQQPEQKPQPVYPEEEADYDLESIVKPPTFNIVSNIEDPLSEEELPLEGNENEEGGAVVVEPDTSLPVVDESGTLTLPGIDEKIRIADPQADSSDDSQQPPIGVPALWAIGEVVQELGYVVSWDPVEGADAYTVFLMDANEESLAMVDFLVVNEGTGYTLPDEKLAAKGAYQIRVSALTNSDGKILEGSASEPMKFVYDPAPAAGEDLTNPPEESGIQTLIEMTNNLAAETFAATLSSVTVEKATGLASEKVTVHWEYTGDMPEYFNVLLAEDGKSAVQTIKATNDGAGRSWEMERKIGNYSVEVQAVFTDATKNTASGSPYSFAVLQSDYNGGVAKEVWAKGTTAINMYKNPGTDYQVSTTLAVNEKLKVVGDRDGFYMVERTNAIDTYGFVRQTDVVDSNPAQMISPKNIANATGENAFFRITWENGDTRAANFQIRIYEKGATTLPAYVDVSTRTSYTHTEQMAYGKTYVAEVRALDAATPQVAAPSESVTIEIPWTVPSTALKTPVFTGDIASGFLLRNTSISTWNAVTGSGTITYDYILYNAQGEAVSGYAGAVAVNSIAASVFAALDAGTSEANRGQYTLAVRAKSNSSGVTPSPWSLVKFKMVETTEKFITGFTTTHTEGSAAVTFTLTGNLPAQVVLCYRDASSATSSVVRKTLTVGGTSNNQVTHTFDTAGTYIVWFENAGGNLPPTASRTLTVGSHAIEITNTTGFSPKKKGTSFNVEWTRQSDVSYFIEIMYADTTLARSIAVTTTPASVPGEAISQIGPYRLRVIGVHVNTTQTIASEWLLFDVVDGSYTEKTGKVKTAGTPTYVLASASTQDIWTSLAKDTEVKVVGELNGYYHVSIGNTTTGIMYRFMLKNALTVSSSSGSGSGSGSGSSGSGSSGSGSSGSRPSGASGGSISATAYKEALGSSALRKSSYTYVPELYAPLMKAMEDGDVMQRTKMELLATSFSSLPDELTSAQYSEVRERAAWNLVTAYMSYFITGSVDDSITSQADAVQQISNLVIADIEELLALGKPLDASVDKVLREVQQSAQKTISDTSGGPLAGTTKKAIVAEALKRILAANDYVEVPYDEVIIDKIQLAMEDPTIVPNEPLEVQLMRVLYALTEYEQEKLTGQVDLLAATAPIAEINAVQDVYLDYVFTVAKLHQMAFAFGGAAADTVVQNWGAEIARLIAVNKVYNTFAQ